MYSKFLFFQVKHLSSLSLLSCMALFIFLFAGCQQSSSESESNSGSTPTGNQSTVDLAQVSFGFSMASARSQVTSSNSTEKLNSSLKSNEIFEGQLLATNTATSATESFDWSIYLDNGTWQVESNRTINLIPANYRFSLLLNKGEQQYAGETVGSVNIIDGTNDVALTIRPIIGDMVTNVSLVSRLADFQFQYNIDELSSFTAPKIGITIDNGNENIFSINKTTGMSEIYQNIDAGQRTIQLKFYDGNVQKGKSKLAQESQLVVIGQNIPMDLIPLYGKTTFSINEESSEADFSFTIPSEVIDEAGGTANLEALFSIVTPHVSHEVALILNASGDEYIADVTLDGFQYAQATLSLTFNDTTQSPKELLGSCTYDITLDINTKVNSCDLTLRRRAVIGGTLYSNLAINVFNENAEPIKDAVIYANDGSNDVQIGITGSGTFGTKGYLDVLLKKGTYTIRAQSGNRSGQKSVTLDSLDVQNLLITLDMDIHQKSCKEILDNGQSIGDGIYTIDPDGSAANASYQVYCDMTTNGGGWTLVAKATGQDRNNLTGDDTNRWLNKTYLGDITNLNAEVALGKSYESVSFQDIMMRSLSDSSKMVSWRHPATINSIFEVVSSGTPKQDGVLLSGAITQLDYRSGCSIGNVPAGVKYGILISDWNDSHPNMTSLGVFTTQGWLNVVVGWGSENSDFISHNNTTGGFGVKASHDPLWDFTRHYHGMGNACIQSEWVIPYQGGQTVNAHGLFVR